MRVVLKLHAEGYYHWGRAGSVRGLSMCPGGLFDLIRSPADRPSRPARVVVTLTATESVNHAQLEWSHLRENLAVYGRVHQVRIVGGGIVMGRRCVAHQYVPPKLRDRLRAELGDGPYFATFEVSG